MVEVDAEAGPPVLRSSQKTSTGQYAQTAMPPSSGGGDLLALPPGFTRDLIGGISRKPFMTSISRTEVVEKVGAVLARLHLVATDTARRINRMPQRVIHALAAVCLIYCCPAPLRAAPPPYADPALAPWFRSLHQPKTNQSCCDRSDCRTVQYRIIDGHFQAFIGGEFARWQNPPFAWVDVPEDSILHRHDNPTGEAVACWSGRTIICFIEGNGA